MSELKNAAERAKKRREILKKPVPMLPDDPDNIRISKADFLAKRRKQKEEELAVEQFKRDRKAKEVTSGVQGEEKAETEVLKKVGRPKRVEDK